MALTSQTPRPPKDRYKPQASVLAADRWMNHFIKVGGIGVIAAVCGIFIFIASQIAPLFGSAKVSELTKHPIALPAGAGAVTVMAVDEWSEKPVFVTDRGRIFAYSIPEQKIEALDTSFLGDRRPTTVDYNQERQDVIFGFDDGQFARINIQYEPDYATGSRTVIAKLKFSGFFDVSDRPERIVSINWGEPDARKRIMVAVTEAEGHRFLRALPMEQKRTLMGPGPLAALSPIDLTSQAPEALERVRINRRGDTILAIGAEGEARFFYFNGTDIVLRQTFRPFKDEEDPRIAAADFVLGDVSVVFTSASGQNRVFSLFHHDGQQTRLFGQIKHFPPLTGDRFLYAPSIRNKAFLVTSENTASLRYMTTERVRWEETVHYKIRQARIGGKYDRILLLDDAKTLHMMKLTDPHPEAGWKAFFGKIWYEGYDKPEYSWQSSGSTDEFEAKLSLIPLIIGSLKGTFYAMLFALPIALFAALYTSQFASPRVKSVVKPVMEIMASLPSVVLGFLAALWLAPLIEHRVPSLILIILVMPLTALLCGFLWARSPRSSTHWIKPGYEFILLVPVLAAVCGIIWQLGPWLESWAFLAKDPVTGAAIADFRLWWPQVTGTPFEQRNSLVVGFVMGFAVIPIIFTITEDALSNVAPALRSASLALGASRWQTAWRVMLPTASAGILSAIMVGFGRAVGETMIVVMATGNTPIMDFNIFSGMRTLSANIAVELPEAPHHSTLYRSLFLGAMMLFMMTFFVNTLAELLRERLRKRYKTV
jgi:phosphate transport system permease protein